MKRMTAGSESSSASSAPSPAVKRRNHRRRVSRSTSIALAEYASEQPVSPARSRNLFGKPLDADTLALARRRMPGEARQALPEVAAADARPPLRVRRHRHDQIGALQADRVMARPEEQPLDDPRQLHERRAVLGQLGEEPP